MKIDVLIEQDDTKFYKIIINTTKPNEQCNINSLGGMAQYFNMPQDYLKDNLLKYNGFILMKKVTFFEDTWDIPIIYYRNTEDANLAKKWIKDNLDSFLIMKALTE
jgi:hypothetical protein